MEATKSYKVGFFKNGQQRAKELSSWDTLEQAKTELKRLFDYDVENIQSFANEIASPDMTNYSQDTNNYGIWNVSDDEELITYYHFTNEKSNQL